MKLCSACLLGIKCRYDGKSKPNAKVIALSKIEKLIPICPEVLGGRSIPRNATEILGGDGLDVLNGKVKVIEKDGKDVSNEFIKGAKEVLKIAKKNKVTQVIMKQRSPSCGCGQIYDGTFNGKVRKGDGVCTALLKKNKIKVVSEEEINSP